MRLYGDVLMTLLALQYHHLYYTGLYDVNGQSVHRHSKHTRPMHTTDTPAAAAWLPVLRRQSLDQHSHGHRLPAHWPPSSRLRGAETRSRYCGPHSRLRSHTPSGAPGRYRSAGSRGCPPADRPHARTPTAARKLTKIQPGHMATDLNSTAVGCRHDAWHIHSSCIVTMRARM